MGGVLLLTRAGGAISWHHCTSAEKLLSHRCSGWWQMCAMTYQIEKKNPTAAFLFSDCNTKINESALAVALSWLDGQKQHNHKLESIMDDSLHMLQGATIKIRLFRSSERTSVCTGIYFHVGFWSTWEFKDNKGHPATHLSLGIWWFGLWWQRMLRPNSLRAVCWILSCWISREVWRSL